MQKINFLITTCNFPAGNRDRAQFSSRPRGVRSYQGKFRLDRMRGRRPARVHSIVHVARCNGDGGGGDGETPPLDCIQRRAAPSAARIACRFFAHRAARPRAFVSLQAILPLIGLRNHDISKPSTRTRVPRLDARNRFRGGRAVRKIARVEFVNGDSTEDVYVQLSYAAITNGRCVTGLRQFAQVIL